MSEDVAWAVFVIGIVLVGAGCAGANLGYNIGHNSGWRECHAHLLNGKSTDLGWEAYKVILPSGEQQYFEYLKTP